MFDRRQYALEEKTSLVPGFRETYEVKDISGSLLLGYAKKQRGRRNFWFEETDGTRTGEIRYVGAHTYEVYDAQNQLRGTMRQVVRASEKRRWRRVYVILLAGIPVVLLGALGAYIGVAGLAVVGIFGGLILGFSALIYASVMVGKGEIGIREWQLEDFENQKLICPPLQTSTPDGSVQLQIVTPDGDVLAEIRRKVDRVSLLRVRFQPWSIDISHRGVKPILILSYAVLIAHMSRPRD